MKNEQTVGGRRPGPAALERIRVGVIEGGVGRRKGGKGWWDLWGNDDVRSDE